MRVATANLYRKNEHRTEDAELLQSLKADFIGTQEDWLFAAGSLPRYRAVTGYGYGKHAREVAGYLHQSHPMRGELVLQCTESTGEDIREHARWATVTFTEADDRKVACLNTHLAAGQFNDGELADDAGGEQYRTHVRLLAETVEWLQYLGYAVVVTMDSNDLHGTAYWSPKRALERVGLAWEQRGLTAVAYDSGAWRLSRRRTVEPVGSDHPWLVLDLEPRRG